MECDDKALTVEYSASNFPQDLFARETNDETNTTGSNSLPFFSACDWPNEFWTSCDSNTWSTREQVICASAAESNADLADHVHQAERTETPVMTPVRNRTHFFPCVFFACACTI